jgi:hypothetical protein
LRIKTAICRFFSADKKTGKNSQIIKLLFGQIATSECPETSQTV